MAVLKYRNPDGTWHTLTGPRGDQGPTGPAGPDGTPGNTLTPEQVDGLYLRLDGGNSMEGTLNAGGQKVTGAAAGVADTDAITVAQITGINRSPVQATATQPAPRAAGDLWIDTSAPILEWDTTWTPLPLAAGWTHYGTPHAFPAYRKLMGGIVELKGLVKYGGQPTGILATLPPGYGTAAGQRVEYVANCGGGSFALIQVYRLQISIQGYVHAAADTSYLSLDGITYYASE